MPDPLGIGDIVVARHSHWYGTGIIIDQDGNRAASLRVLFDDDYDDWFHEAELAYLEVKAAA